MRHIIRSTDGAPSGAAGSPFDRRAHAVSWLRLAVVALLLAFLVACGGGQQAVNQPPPTDPATQPAGELSGPGPSGVASGSVLQGVLWSDSDGDGLFGPGDMVLANTPVVLELEGGESIVVMSDEVGQYRLTGIVPGTAFTLRHRLRTKAAAPVGQPAQLSTSRSEAQPQLNVKHYLWQGERQ